MSPAENLADGLTKLAQAIDEVLPAGEARCQFGPVWLSRVDAPTKPEAALYTPMFCLVAQGAKALFLGDERHVYAPGRFLLNSVAVPASGGVLEASPERPCLWAMVEMDAALVGSVILESGHAEDAPSALPTLGLSTVTPEILDATTRLVKLCATPTDFPHLAPLVQRELVYRLLGTDQGPRLRQIAVQGGRAERVLRAVEWLRDHYAQPMTIEGLAQECGLSPSALHHHFKEVTAMSPLRYQKQLRLQEAHRLMVGEGLDAAGAGLRVGYDDPSQFSREYRRFFGDPPRRHAERVRSGTA